MAGPRLPAGLAYRINNILYVSLTNSAVGRSFLELRGAGYRFPTSSGFRRLPPNHVVNADEVATAVELAFGEDVSLPPFGTVFAGHCGDPLLEIDILVRS